MPLPYYRPSERSASRRWAFFIACLSCLASGSSALAGFYSPTEPIPFHGRPDGTVEELSFGKESDGEFPRRFATLTNEADSNPARVNNHDRTVLLERIAANAAKTASNAIDEKIAAAADLFRVDRVEEAMKLLEPLSRERIPDFRVLADLAHMHARLGEWDEATSRHQSALLDADFPELSGTKAEQRRWLMEVEKKYYPRWLKEHRRRAIEKQSPETEEIFPLFDMQFLNDRGIYEPGKLVASERAKLPKDAVAITQQLLLWAPWETSLYWLLAELYAAEGRFREAEIIFDQCAGGRQFSNRKVFMEHRNLVREASRRMTPEKDAIPDLQPPQTEPSQDFFPSQTRMIVFGAVFFVIVIAMVLLQVRVLRRRKGS